MTIRILAVLLALLAAAPLIVLSASEAGAVGARIDDNGLDLGGGP